VRKLGQFVVMACPLGPVQFDVATFLMRQIKMSAAVSHDSASWDIAAALINRGQVQLDILVSDIFPLDRWQEALARSDAHEGLKVLLKP
jgi:L-iditol 2-dehydrogenase